MAELFTSGRVIDLILVFFALELLGLVALRRRLGRGSGPLETVAQLFPGVLLMLAVRSALVGDPWTKTGLLLSASLPAHGLDLWLRLRRSPGA